MGSSLLEIVVIALLITVNGVFVAAEIALVTVRRSRIRQLSDEGDERAKRVARMTEKPGGLLATLGSRQASGILTVRQGKILKKICFLGGTVRFVISMRGMSPMSESTVPMNTS